MPLPFLSRRRVLAVLAGGPLLLAGGTAQGDGPVDGPGTDEAVAGLHAALAARVDAVPGQGPVFLASYEPDPATGPLEPALRGAAFTYDNALAAMALLARGDRARARRLGAALAAAAAGDRHYADGRVRNAYRAGPAGTPPLPPGWWDTGSGTWAEDATMVGTATGNVCWAALALLALHDDTGNAGDAGNAGSGAGAGTPGGTDWLGAARRLLGWVAATVRNPAAAGGFTGGFHGHEPAPVRLGWVSTEHNIDAFAAFSWLARATGENRWEVEAAVAGRFVAAMWDARAARFLTGTLPDGVTPSRAGSYLDAQLWPLLAFPDGPERWGRVLEMVAATHTAEGGLDFNGDRDGLWVEGTAQGALAWRRAGSGRAGQNHRAEARRLLAVALAERAPGGLLHATRAPSISTGLALGPDSTEPDFRYYRRPHLGATAWAVLAAEGWNPFTGRRLD
ncbi:hypothetical protein [Rhodocista pekingensis]|uniref:Methylaspartate ammonia-lyase n=1 Tax=Rhodocista pekingensis TaxID=201185 RepID=A0ABW2KW20_9PROT